MRQWPISIGTCRHLQRLLALDLLASRLGRLHPIHCTCLLDVFLHGQARWLWSSLRLLLLGCRCFCLAAMACKHAMADLPLLLLLMLLGDSRGRRLLDC